MRTALISDIHGNAVALEAVLADLERDPVDQVVCLGDAVQGGAQPGETVEALRGLACPTVLGNADAFLLDPDAGREVPTERQLETRLWSLGRLGESGVEYLRSFVATIELDLGWGRTLLGFHGSPASYDDVLLPHLPEDEFRRLVGPPAAEVFAGGHVHLQYLRRYGESLFVNPGSVGLGYDHAGPEGELRLDAFAAYARVVVDEGRLEVAFRRVPFSREAVTAAIEASGMPHMDELRPQWA